MDRQTITERKTRLDGTSVDFTCERLRVEPGRRAVLRYHVDRDWTVSGGVLTVPRSAVTIAHYWMDRPYNVYHWLVDGRTLAYYCNVAEPTEISESLVAYTDLVVDVLIRPDGSHLVLDEDELPADLDPRRRSTVARALDLLGASPKRLIREIESETAASLNAQA